LRAESGAAPDPTMEFALRISEGAPPDVDRVLFRWHGRYQLVLGASGDDWVMRSAFDGVFRIDMANRTIDCFITDAQGGAWLDVFMRRVAPRIAMLAGACALHGAAAAIGGGAVLMLGASGAGKSTMSGLLSGLGWDVLSDDVSLLLGDAAPHVAPATTGVCLWRDSRAALQLDAARCTPMPGYDGKARFTSGHDVATVPVPLKALVFLSRTSMTAAPSVVAIPGAEAMVRAAQQRIRFNPADTSGVEARTTFGKLAAIVRATPCYELSYPADYAALGAVAEQLHALTRR
jgi:hypothetical protein